ncbi:MAG: hypothetical protein LBH98_04475 [Chitinispirillales bacterium]|jgi:hypothetical protein|nr:hypothetical protein [Chitinispirillales bacterium]
MEITNSKTYTDLQAVMAAARQKNTALSRSTESVNKVKTNSTNNLTKISGFTQNVTDISQNSGKLVDRLYGNSNKKQEQTPNRLGSRFDTYA